MLVGLHAEKACIFTKQPLEMALASLSASIRRLLAKYRQIYEDDTKFRIVLSKAKPDLWGGAHVSSTCVSGERMHSGGRVFRLPFIVPERRGTTRDAAAVDGHLGGHAEDRFGSVQGVGGGPGAAAKASASYDATSFGGVAGVAEFGVLVRLRGRAPQAAVVSVGQEAGLGQGRCQTPLGLEFLRGRPGFKSPGEFSSVKLVQFSGGAWSRFNSTCTSFGAADHHHSEAMLPAGHGAQGQRVSAAKRLWKPTETATPSRASKRSVAGVSLVTPHKAPTAFVHTSCNSAQCRVHFAGLTTWMSGIRFPAFIERTSPPTPRSLVQQGPTIDRKVGKEEGL